MSDQKPLTDEETLPITFRVPKTLRQRIEAAAAKDRRNITSYLIVTLEATVPALPAQKTTQNSSS
jgi:uncharacterized protein (DUF1778 family)